MNKIASLSMSLRLPSCGENSDNGRVLTASTRCAVCGIEVPLDEAVVPEAADQLTYICGLDCYARWRAIAAIAFPSVSPESD
jgi:Domain of unknown function (DUF3330)